LWTNIEQVHRLKYSSRGPANLKKDNQAYLQGINKGVVKESERGKLSQGDFPPMVELALALLQCVWLFFLVFLLDFGIDLFS